ncbi:MAG: FUSC family protein [Caldimonas sp.]
MKSTLNQSIRSILKVEWSEFETLAALRCTIGVAVPLLTGLAIDQPVVGVFGAAGAVGVGFGSFQGAYRGRAAVMLLATIGMACSVFIGSVAGYSSVATIGVAALWAFAGGLLVALGMGASIVGVQSIVALALAGGFPSDFEGAVGRAALVLGGGVVQTLLVVMIWPLRRFAVERRSLAAVYRSLTEYALTITDSLTVSPEPHTFAGTPSLLDDPQPFARSGEIFVFQALLDEGERIRASLAAFAIYYRRLGEVDQACARTLTHLMAQALAEIAVALDGGREPREQPGFSAELTRCVERLSSSAVVETLLRQVRAAWRTAGVPTAVPGHLAPRREHSPRRRRRPIRDGLITLRANLTMRSTACRHALRLAAILTVATAGGRILELPRGYWLPLTIALVLKPDFHDTFAFSLGRVAGTVLGAAGATAIAIVFAPGPVALVVLVLAFVWGAYGFGIPNYSAASLCITGYVVFLMTLAGIPGATAATDRIIYTVIAGGLALCAYAAWPTWASTRVRPAIAAALETQSRYMAALLAAYAPASPPDLKELDEIRASTRLARSNSEAVVERMLAEPRSRSAMTSRTAVGIVAALRRSALAALSLHAGLERDMRAAVPGVEDLALRVSSSLLALATATRARSAPPRLTALRGAPIVEATGSNGAVRDETDLIVDSIETIAELLAKDAGHDFAEHSPAT